MIRFRTRGLLVCAALAVLLVVPGVARADVLNDWNVIAQNEAVEKVEVTVSMVGEAKARLLTASGKAYDVPYAALRAAGFRG